MKDFRVKTKGGRSVGPPREIPRVHLASAGDGTMASFENAILASRREKDDLRRHLAEVRAERDRIDYDRGFALRQAEDFAERLAACSRDLQSAQAAERHSANLAEMLKEENELLRGKLESLVEFQKMQKVDASEPLPHGALSEEDFSTECPICFANFDHQEVAPVVWQCGHIVCSTCSSKLSGCATCRAPKQFVSAKCGEYLRVVELLRVKLAAAKEKTNE